MRGRGESLRPTAAALFRAPVAGLGAHARIIIDTSAMRLGHSLTEQADELLVWFHGRILDDSHRLDYHLYITQLREVFRALPGAGNFHGRIRPRANQEACLIAADPNRNVAHRGAVAAVEGLGDAEDGGQFLHILL